MSGSSFRLAGYAALFGVRDGARDRILPGAFAATLAARRSVLPLLWEHRADQVVGVAEYVAEDARGLRIVARVDRPGSRAAALLREGQLTGLSFGYRARAFRHTAAGRDLHCLDLFEVSLVAQPLQHRARVHLLGPAEPAPRVSLTSNPFPTERTLA